MPAPPTKSSPALDLDRGETAARAQDQVAAPSAAESASRAAQIDRDAEFPAGWWRKRGEPGKLGRRGANTCELVVEEREEANVLGEVGRGLGRLMGGRGDGRAVGAAGSPGTMQATLAGMCP